jgi:hypothetical protein
MLSRCSTNRRSREGTLQQIPPELVREINAGNCVAFVGAGFSAAANLPSWAQLLARLATEAGNEEVVAHVQACIQRGSAHAFDEAAQVLDDCLERPRLLACIKRHLSPSAPGKQMEQRLQWMRGIPFRAILTTNFDTLLPGESPGPVAYREVLRPHEYRWWEPRFWEADPDHWGASTVKLHGDLSDDRSDTLVFTRRDYRRRLYSDAAYATFLRAVMSTTTVLYLGFSFEDAYLNELRSEVLALLGHEETSQPVAYAVLNDVPGPSRSHFEHHEGVRVLGYDSKNRTDFSGFDEYLRGIYEATNPVLRFGHHLSERRILWLDPHPENNREAHEFLRMAAEQSRRAPAALVLRPAVDQALAELRTGHTQGSSFDLVITHWGDGQARDESGRPVPVAERLLSEMRRQDLRCPVIVFAAETDAQQRRQKALRLGAYDYCFTFQTLFRRMDELFSSAAENG